MPIFFLVRFHWSAFFNWKYSLALFLATELTHTAYITSCSEKMSWWARREAYQNQEDLFNRKMLTLKLCWEEKLWLWKSSGLWGTKRDPHWVFCVYCGGVLGSLQSFILLISFNPHQYPGRSLFIKSLTNSFIDWANIRYWVPNMCQDFLEVKWDETWKALNNWVNHDVTKIRVRARLWVRKISIPFWSLTILILTTFQIGKLTSTGFPEIAWLPGDDSGTGNLVSQIPEPSFLCSIPKPWGNEAWLSWVLPRACTLLLSSLSKVASFPS